MKKRHKSVFKTLLVVSVLLFLWELTLPGELLLHMGAVQTLSVVVLLTGLVSIVALLFAK